MGNITGNPFRKWVTEQINTRQNALGQYSNIDPKNLLYYTTKTPWIRLASSVNVNKGKVLDDLIKTGFTENELIGDNLAKNFILQGGSLSQSSGSGENNSILNYGLNQGKTFSGAYGWGGIEDRGFVPLPGITDAKFTYYSNGTYGKAEIQIQCFSRKQMAILDALYLRPGYTLLLEFGWSVYLDNKGNLKTFDNFTSSPLNYLFNPAGENRTHFDVYKKIKEEKKKHYGNYEAVYGKIHHFKWSFQNDGSYICTVAITGMGDIIESLKLNIIFPTPPIKNTNPNFGAVAVNDEGVPIQELIQNTVVSNQNKNELANILNEIYNTYQSNTGTTRQNYSLDIPDYKDGFKAKNVTINNAIFALPQAKKDNTNAGIHSYYITFGTLLAIIYSKLLLYDKINNNDVPLFRFDMDFFDLDQDENYILRVPGEFSGDPSKCLVGIDNSYITNIIIPQPKWIELLSRGAKWIVDNNPYVGRLANVYISIGYILDVLNNIPKEKDGSITLLSFLKEIINTIQSSLGNINSIVIKEDPQEGTIRFIENAPQRLSIPPTKDENGDELSLARFNLYGVKPGVEGSFVRNLSLEAEISNDLATMIVAGAQINSNQLTVNATAFKQYNDGLKDRVLTERTNWVYTPPTNSTGSNEEAIIKLWDEKININNSGVFNTVYNSLTWTSENLLSLKELNTQYLQLSTGDLTEKKQIPTPFFMPFKLGFDMDGISGIRLWEKFLIDDRILPPAYGEDNVDLQVTAVNHTINRSAWITHIDTVASPAIKSYPGLPQGYNRPPVKNSNITQQQPANQQLPNNPGLREVLRSAGYNERSFIFQLALFIGTQEGYRKNSPNAAPVRNNNPGNLDFSFNFRTLDPGVIRDPLYKKRFAKFSTPELGAKALVEFKIKRWSNGNYPDTIVNGSGLKSKQYQNTYNVPLSVRGIAGKKVPLNLVQFIYIYAPPSDNNNTEGYINSLESSIKSIYPNFSKNSPLINWINR